MIKKIKIGAVKYKVNLIKASALESDDKSALLNRGDNTITIDIELSKENQLIALWHEIFHQINGELSETDVDFLANAMHQILSENKGLC